MGDGGKDALMPPLALDMLPSARGGKGDADSIHGLWVLFAEYVA